MPLLSWRATTDGRYWIDILLGSHPTRLMIDLGIVDPQHRVAFELEPSLYDTLAAGNELIAKSPKTRRDASGSFVVLPRGEIVTRLIDPATGQPAGPVVTADVVRGFPRVPNRVGVVFFHLLAGCNVRWDLSAREWSVDHP